MIKHKLLAITFLVFAQILYGSASTSQQQGLSKKETKLIIRTDSNSIEAGRLLFGYKCRKCHDPYTDGGSPVGLHAVLKRDRLPVSGKPATPANIAKQIRHPFYEMPQFAELSDDDIESIIAFLNTL